MADDFKYDVFLSHSAKDKKVVRGIAKRLRGNGLRVWFDGWEIKPGDDIPAKIEEGLEQSRVLVLCMSANAFGSDWAQLEAGTFRFRDPVNKERRFIALDLDEARTNRLVGKFLYINWLPEVREHAYAMLLMVCRSPEKPLIEALALRERVAEKAIELNHEGAGVWVYDFSPDGKRALTGAAHKSIQLWDLETGKVLRTLKGHRHLVRSVAWSSDQRRALSAADDGTVRLWNLQTGQCLHKLRDHWVGVNCVAWSADQRRALSGGDDETVRLWDLDKGCCLRVLKHHSQRVWSVAWSADQRRALSGSEDSTVRVWDLVTWRRPHVLEGHGASIQSVAWSADQRFALSGSVDMTVRVWDVETGRTLRVLEGHTASVTTVAWSANQRCALSASEDSTVRLWDVDAGRCLCVLEGHETEVMSVAWSSDGRRAFSGDAGGGVRMWDLSEFVAEAPAPESPTPVLPPAPDQVQYTNAKILLVGDTSSGKTALAHRLATGKWKPSDGSTVGAWSTQWKLSARDAEPGVNREIWLWDFGGQADQRLIHQLYMDRTALILLLFNADQEDVLQGLRDWQTAVQRCVPPETPQLLVAGRIDTGFKASRSKLKNFAEQHDLQYHETSSLDGTGCVKLHEAIMSAIPWDQMERRTSPQVFKLIKDAILTLRDEGKVLHTFKELRELLWKRLPQENRFTDATLQTVIRLLDGPGIVKELDYGTYILLQPEWVNTYAQAVFRTLRSDETELGCLPLRSIAEGNLVYQRVERDGSFVEMKRLPPPEERIVLGEMEQQLQERGLCLRQGDKLVFPSHCGRDRPEIVEYPSVFVSYELKGYLDNIYSTLVVRLADSEAFLLDELWRDAADFATLEGGYRMGIKLTRNTAGSGIISVYFGPGVTKQEQVIFANYIHAHLEENSAEVQRLRYYVCPKCNTRKGNAQVLMDKLLEKKKGAKTVCDKCDEPFALWDALEKRFASKAVREEVEGLQADDAIRLDARRKGKLLVLDVGARITSADQKWHEIPQEEDEGIDVVLEFTEDNGQGSGKHLYLQLKAGNSHLNKRKNDGVEIFRIKKQSWVKYWLKQQGPVMLVIGTFAEDDERLAGKDKLAFADVRWMEISSYLKRESKNGKKPVKQIEFRGERLDMTSVHRWRKKVLAGELDRD